MLGQKAEAAAPESEREAEKTTLDASLGFLNKEESLVQRAAPKHITFIVLFCFYKSSDFFGGSFVISAGAASFYQGEAPAVLVAAVQGCYWTGCRCHAWHEL